MRNVLRCLLCSLVLVWTASLAAQESAPPTADPATASAEQSLLRLTSGFVALAAIAVAGLGLVGGAILMGGRLRREARKELPEIPAPNPNYFLRPAKPSVSPSLRGEERPQRSASDTVTPDTVSSDTVEPQ